jgi:uncharacterized protein
MPAMPTEAPIWTPVSGGVRLRVRLTPRSGRDAVEGIEATTEGPALKVRVRAVPESGRANSALIETVARWLDLPKSSVAMAAGAKSRCKLLLVRGEQAPLAARMAARVAQWQKEA